MTGRVVKFKYLLLTVCGIALFIAAHEEATARRGYAAIGGECFFVLLPVLWLIVESAAKDIKATRLEKSSKK